MKNKIIVLLIIIALAMVNFLFQAKNLVTERDLQIKEMEVSNQTLQNSSLEQTEEIDQLEAQVKELQEANKKLTRDIGATLLETLTLATEDGYEVELFVYDSEEEASETPMLYKDGGEYFFFVKYDEKMENPSISVNGKEIEIIADRETLHIEAKHLLTETVMIKITYQYCEQEIHKYLKLLVPKG